MEYCWLGVYQLKTKFEYSGRQARNETILYGQLKE